MPEKPYFARSGAISRREFLKLAGTTMAGAVLAACAPGLQPTRAAASGEKVQLVYQDWRTDWFPEMAQRLLDDFHDTHPNIRVFYTPDPDNLEEKMPLDMAAGTAADVIQGCCDYFPIWSQKEYLLDLQPFIDADLDKATIDDWDPAQYAALKSSNGKRFGVPKYHGALALYFNKDLFDEFKVSYPDESWTYDDYLDAMRKLTHDRDGDGKTDLWGSMLDVSWDRLQVHVNAWGGHFVDPSNPRKSMMGAPESLEALEWVRARMWDDKVMASFLNVQNMETRQAFTNGKIAMVEDGSWALKDILVGSDFRVGIAVMPQGPAKRVTLATTDAFGIYSGTRNPEAAWELVKYLISKEYGLAMAKANYLQPARASLVQDWVDIIRSELAEKAREVDINAFADGHLRGYSVTAEIFENMDAARNLVRPAWEQIFTLGQAPTSILADISREIETRQTPNP